MPTPRLLLACVLLACSKDQAATPEAGPSASASATAASSVSASASATVAASASAAPEPPHDCPPGSTGIGSFSKPCEAKGSARMVEVAWNGKYDDKGAPWFKVNSKAPKPMLYGRIAVYFYDKAGKQIDVKEAPEGSDKTHAFHLCSGNVFAGTVAPGEKARYVFSCVGKSNIPDGTAAIEAEAQFVGFADATGKKNDFYWRNADLTPEARPKGGVK